MRALRVIALVVFVALAFLLGSLFFDPSPWKAPEGVPSITCREFDHRTNGRTCRILWCEQAVGSADRGGPATLWCDVPDAGVPDAAARWW